MDVVINQMVGIFSQICISNHLNVHFKYLAILFVSYISIKLEKKKAKIKSKIERKKN